MARGNYVDAIRVTKRFGLYICTPYFKHQSFGYYKSIYISKGGTLIGKWGEYRDYISVGWKGFKILRRTDKYLFLQP